MPKVSIVIPIYNASLYMNTCLESVLKQSMEDYEVILVDDGSTDDSYAMALEWAEQYPEKIMVYTQANAGQGDARNNGILYARGTYIMFVDSDDTVSEDFVEAAYQNISENQSDIAIFDAIVVDEQGKKLQDMTGCHTQEQIITLESFPHLLLEYPCPWNKIYKRSLFIDNHLKYPTHMWYEDLAGACMFYVKADKISVFHKQLYYYMQRTTSVMHSKVSEKNIEILKAVDIILNYYEKQGIRDKFAKELESMAIYHVLIAGAGRTVRGDAKSKFPAEFMTYMGKTFPTWEKSSYIQELSKANRVKLWLLKHGQYRLLHVLYKIGKANTI